MNEIAVNDTFSVRTIRPGHDDDHTATSQRCELRVANIVGAPVTKLNSKWLEGFLAKRITYFLSSHLRYS